MMGLHRPVRDVIWPEMIENAAPPSEKGSMLQIPRMSMLSPEHTGDRVKHLPDTGICGGRAEYLEVYREIVCTREEGEGVQQ